MKQPQLSPIKISIIIMLAAIMLALTPAPPPLLAQETPIDETQSEEAIQQREEAARQQEELRETLTTLTRLLSDKKQQQQIIRDLKKELRGARENVTKTELEEKLKEETQKLTDVDNQITSLTSGITNEAFYSTENKAFDLQKELQSLAEPFIKMIKSTTEDARVIDNLQTVLTESRRRQTAAKRALERIDQLKKVETNDPQQKPKLTQQHLKSQETDWKKRLEDAVNLETTTKSQLQLKEKANRALDLNNYATDFIRTRGLNFLIAVLTFFSVLIILRLVDRIASMLFYKSGLKKSFYARLAKVSFEFFTIAASLITTMIVLNYMNDWILLGIAGLFTLALAWISLKVLPAIIEQTVLLLNLGAVQEGERLLIDGVPWRVKTLDHYTDFENPALEGGHFTLPIRELIGRHSRPAAEGEAWFPTKKGDWVQFENGNIARVTSQTPELVQLIELGGARITYTTQDFISESFRNLSTGFRIRQEFGIAYAHQHEAVDTIPQNLKSFLHKGLSAYLTEGDIHFVDVGLIRAGASSLDFVAEVDIKGNQASHFEDIEGEITRLIIMACNEYKLELPFPQLVVHQTQK